MSDKTLREAAENMLNATDWPAHNIAAASLRIALADSADAPEGPWKLRAYMVVGTTRWEVSDGPDYLIVGIKTEAEAIAVRDALNRLDAQQESK